MWSKEIEKRKKASGFKKERLERSNPLKDLKPFFVGDGMHLAGHMFKGSG
jgi:hypothetical protein